MARTYLNCPFAEKDEAKSLGARWDGVKKRWYTEAADLAPFGRWLKEAGAPAARVDSAPPVRTGPKEVPHCGCAVLPWEPCIHTPAGRA